MAQYRGSATKRGFNPKRVESKVNSITQQTNRTLQAMRDVRSIYSEQRAEFASQLKENQKIFEDQLDRNQKIELENANNKIKAAQGQAQLVQNQQIQDAKATKAILDGLSNFSESAGAAATEIALQAEKRVNFTDWNNQETGVVLDSMPPPDEAMSGLQDDETVIGIGYVQSAEATGAIPATESRRLQAQFSSLSPSQKSAQISQENNSLILSKAYNRTLTLPNGQKSTVGEALNGEYAGVVAREVLSTYYREKYGKLNYRAVRESTFQKEFDRTVKSYEDAAATKIIRGYDNVNSENAISRLTAPIAAQGPARQAQINASYQQAIQLHPKGFVGVLEAFKTRYVDADGNLVGPTAAELYAASVAAEGPGRPRMNALRLAELEKAEAAAFKSYQTSVRQDKTADAQGLWEELQKMPEFDAIDINDPDSQSAREFIASMKKAYSDQDLPMPAAARQWIRDIETGTKAKEAALYNSFVDNPNSLEEDSYEQFNDPSLRRKVYDMWVGQTKGYGSNWDDIKKQFETKAATEAMVKYQPNGEAVSTVQSRAIERRLQSIFRAKFGEEIKKTPDDPTGAAERATTAALEQFNEFKKRDASDPNGEYYKIPGVSSVGTDGARVFFPNMAKFDAEAAQSRKAARDAVKLTVKNEGIKAAVEEVSIKLKPRLASLARRYDANPSDFTYPVEVTELAELTGKKPSAILNMMMEAAGIETVPDFQALQIIESDPELVKSMNSLYRTNVITQRAGAYGSNTTSQYGKHGGGAVASLIIQGEGDANSVNRGTAGDTPGGSMDVFGAPLSQVTVEQIMTAQANGDVFAVGKFQVIPKTMMQWMRSGHPSAPKPNEMFTDAVQSRFFSYVADVKRPAIGAYLNGETSDPTEAAQALAREFASVGLQYPEAGRTRGQSRYAGTGGNAATITPDQAVRALKQQRQRNVGQTSRTSREANGAGLISFRRNVVAQPVLERSDGQPGLDIYFEDKQFPVVMAGRVKEHGFQKGYGNFTVIESVDPVTGEKVDVLYSHLAQPSNLLVGSRVKSGELVGIQGGTGNVQSIDGTIASIDFLAPAPAGSKSMTPYMHYDSLRRRVSSNLGHPQ